MDATYRLAVGFGGEDRNVIVGKSKEPTKDEGALQVVSTSVMRLMNHCVDGVKDCAEKNWSSIGFRLNGSEMEEADSKPSLAF
jgi:hypothetical protein